MQRAKIAFFALVCAVPLASCAKGETDLFSYVSELRDNILVASTTVSEENGEEKTCVLSVYSLLYEVPYLTDGLCGNLQRSTSFYFMETDGSSRYLLRFSLDEKENETELSYDDVKKRYYCSFPLDSSALESLDVTIENEKTGVRTQFHATSVKTDDVLSPREALNALSSAESETFKALYDGDDFLAEIRIRLIRSEGAIYYYAGIVSREKTVVSYLLEASTGKILAKRESTEN